MSLCVPCVAMDLTLRMYHHILCMFVCDTSDHTHGATHSAHCVLQWASKARRKRREEMPTDT